MMKIAILLRGQSRFADVSAKLFDLFVRQRYPQHEFQIFGATWRSVSSVLTDQNLDSEDKIYGRELNQHYLSDEEINDNIRDWNLKNLDIVPDSTLFEQIKEICTDRANDYIYKAFINDYLNTYDWNDSDTCNSFFCAPRNIINNRGFDEKSFKHDIIRTTYVLGQCYSFSRAYSVYQQYIKENNDEKPDLIISMRYDTFIFPNGNRYFEILHDYIVSHEREQGYSRGKAIYSNTVSAYKNQIFLDDLIFFMLPDNIRTFAYGSEYDSDTWLKTLLTKYKNEAFGMMHAREGFQHSLWAYWGRECYFYQLITPLKMISNIVRPTFEFNKIDYNTKNTNELHRNLVAQSIKFTYPETNATASEKIIDDAWNNLLKH